MRNKYLLLVVLLFNIHIGVSQKIPFFKNYDWDENPNYKIGKNNNDESVISIKHKVVTEFCFEEKTFTEYFLEHKILWLNSDKKIETYNKIYLPYLPDSNFEVNKARVITKEGEIINLDKSKILTSNNEETGEKHKYFAFEGISKGSFIEYMYVVKRDPYYRGRKINLQASYNKNIVEFDLFSPKHMVFEFKSYNNIPPIVRDTITKEKHHWKLRLNDISKIEKEDDSAYGASKGFIVYKLDKNIASNIYDISSYSKVSQNIYNFYYPEYNKKIRVLINKLISKLKFASGCVESWR